MPIQINLESLELLPQSLADPLHLNRNAAQLNVRHSPQFTFRIKEKKKT